MEKMSVSEEKYEKALAYATAMHAGQMRIGGEPYITHPVAVAELLKEQGYGLDYQIAGLFHDLLEDTDATEEAISELGSPRILKTVKILTKYRGYRMAEYVAAIRKDEMAFAVKSADRLHNLRTAYVTSEAFRRKYIQETKDWYLDFSPEIAAETEKLERTLQMSLV